MQTTYSRLTKVWDQGLALTGFKRGLQSFVRRLPIKLPKNAHVVEVGCGTGVVTTQLARKFPDAHITATDIDEKMLRQARVYTQKISSKQQGKVIFAESDAEMPQHIVYADGNQASLIKESYDLVVASAVLEHTNLSISIPALIALLKPGGLLLNIAMSSSVMGHLYGKVFHFTPLTTAEIIQHLVANDCTDIIEWPLQLSEFPACLTRVGILASKAFPRE